MEGLRPRQQAAKDDADGHRVPSALRSAHPTPRLRPNPAVWLLGEPLPGGTPDSGQTTSGCRTIAAGALSCQTPRAGNLALSSLRRNHADRTQPDRPATRLPMRILRHFVTDHKQSGRLTCNRAPTRECAWRCGAGIIWAIATVPTFSKSDRGHDQNPTFRHCAGPSQAYPKYQTRIGHP